VLDVGGGCVVADVDGDLGALTEPLADAQLLAPVGGVHVIERGLEELVFDE
jgi:hypothetical protein